jgi:UDP-N-acetylglucosamine diphosphorylase/glucosamine-1-phosphate N-acetyltransferase
MNIILHDGGQHTHLLPITFTRPVADIRIGILTIAEKYQKHNTNASISYSTQGYLAAKYPCQYANENYVVNACYCPTEDFNTALTNLSLNTLLVDASTNNWIAIKLNAANAKEFCETLNYSNYSNQTYNKTLTYIARPNDIFTYNDVELCADFELITKGRVSQPISTTNTCIAPQNIFIEEGGKVECSILNASTGPIYVGVDAEIMEGSIIRGALALCAHSALKLGTKIYGATTIGPHSKVGGEINNSVIIGYSNKAHDGFLGNSVIGEWCNLGADTNNSNLKNNYGSVKLYNYASNVAEDTHLQFCGLIMGDHSKCGINTMFNTGTVVGVCANVFGAGFPATHITSYTWGGIAPTSELFKLDKAIELAKRVYARRAMELTTNDIAILTHVFSKL